MTGVQTCALPISLLSVATGAEYGNAMVAVRNKRTDKIAWSWHIWVTDYDPDEAVSNFQFVRDETYTTGSNNNLSWHLDETTDGEGGNLYLYMKNTLGYVTYSNGNWNNVSDGLFYQWGRKDPFKGWNGSIFPNNGDNALDMVGSDGLELSINHPDRKASGTNYYGEQENYNDLWGADSERKSQYDPCPIGWRVPTDKEFVTMMELKTTVWTSSYTDIGNSNQSNLRRILADNNQYLTWAAATNSYPLRCIREGAIKVAARPEAPKDLVLEWEKGIINPLSTEEERARTQFSVKAYYDNAPSDVLTTGITYTWYINNSPVEATTNNFYDHAIARFKDQSILLKCRAVDNDGRVAETTAEWMVMKRSFVNASLVTFQNSGDYLATEADYINGDPANRSRVRYLRDPLSSNVYRVKLMSDNKWWLIQDYREAKLDYINNKVTDHIEGQSFFYKNRNSNNISNLCPSGWRLPSDEELLNILWSTNINSGSGNSANYKTIPEPANSNYRVTDECNASHFEAQINGYGSSASSITMGGYSSYIVTSYAGGSTQYLFEVNTSNENIQWRIQRNNSNYHSVRCVKN